MRSEPDCPDTPRSGQANLLRGVTEIGQQHPAAGIFLHGQGRDVLRVAGAHVAHRPSGQRGNQPKDPSHGPLDTAFTQDAIGSCGLMIGEAGRPGRR